MNFFGKGNKSKDLNYTRIPIVLGKQWNKLLYQHTSISFLDMTRDVLAKLTGVTQLQKATVETLIEFE